MKKQWNAEFNGTKMTNGEIISAIFENRNIDDAAHFLNPTEDDLIPFDKMHNIGEAFNMINTALTYNKSILIIADVDTDGVTAAAIIGRYLKNFTDKISYYINEGKKHGVEDFNVCNYNEDLIVIVDSINEPSAYDKFSGKDVVILDHHIIPDNFNVNAVLVSSADNYPNPQLSGAGVVWKFCKYCDEMFLTDYADKLTDLAACGIIADMVDMTSPENRYICLCGFKNLQNPGIKKINGNYKFDSQSVSYGIAPLVNAANRLSLNRQALELFISDNDKEIAVIIKELKSAKEQQNEIISKMLPAIEEQARSQINNKVMFFTAETDTGVLGLIANQLMTKYCKPVFVLRKKDNEYSGSVRSCGVDNFKKLVDRTGLAVGAGHENAFGVSISSENYDKFKPAINSLFDGVVFVDMKKADVEISLKQIDNNLISDIKHIDYISGVGFKPVKIIIRNITDYDVGSMSGGKHLKISAGDFLIIKWNFQGDFDEFNGRPFSVIGSLNSGYLGKVFYKQIIIDDYMFEEGE